MKKILVSSIALALMCGVAQAAFLANWGAAGVVTVYDPADFTASPGRDILSLQCVYQDSGYYFRMNLEGAPSGADSAGVYMINIDDAPGGANDGSSVYVADGLTSINKIFDAHYNPAGVGYFSPVEYHSYVAGTPPGVEFSAAPGNSVGGIFNDQGISLEWFVPEALINQGAKIYASTLNVNGETFDITSELILPVPEPTSMALLALGMVALGLRRKVRK